MPLRGAAGAAGSSGSCLRVVVGVGAEDSFGGVVVEDAGLCFGKDGCTLVACFSSSAIGALTLSDGVVSAALFGFGAACAARTVSNFM
ncbi:hypothetical protein D3C85_1531740 [compost metagenome]